jgi:pimeloyl-ACP methyl ester carboxylesterase
VVFDYDMRIAEPFKVPGGATGFDPWRAFAALTATPTLAVRGATSDILSPATLARMEAAHPLMEAVTVPNVGHAPTLEEPEAVAAIDALLARVG